jgi:AraC family transcriptional regulator of adaptative response / DNA-3-methyladenine glycosylase II
VTRLVTDELGAGPLAIARAQRAHSARKLLETTDLRLADAAREAGLDF